MPNYVNNNNYITKESIIIKQFKDQKISMDSLCGKTKNAKYIYFHFKKKKSER